MLKWTLDVEISKNPPVKITILHKHLIVVVFEDTVNKVLFFVVVVLKKQQYAKELWNIRGHKVES